MRFTPAKVVILGCIVALGLNACGGSSDNGSDSNTPAASISAPTTTTTKVASEMGVTAVRDAAGAGGQAGLQSMIVSKLPVKALTPYSGKVEMTCSSTESSNDCQGLCSGGGKVTIVGSATATCSGTEASWTCSNMKVPLTITFSECQVTRTINTITYTELMTGTVTSTLTANVSGTSEGPTGGTFSADMAGTIALTGDIIGSIVLNNVTYSGSATEGTDTCTGTSDITIANTTEVCTVATDCSGCIE